MAEDNITNQIVASEILKVFGCQTTITSNGMEAVQAVATKTFDLIFMDCQMPIMDDFEATRLIRNTKEISQPQNEPPLSS